MKTLKKDTNSILEFLFKDTDKNPEALEDYITKYLEAREKWRLVFECVQKTDITTSIEDYLIKLIQNMKEILPNLKIAIVLYEKERGKNKVFSIEEGELYGFLKNSIFKNFNLFNTHIETLNFFENKKINSNFRLFPLEKEDMELGYIFFETENFPLQDVNFFENLCGCIISSLENIGLYTDIKDANSRKTKLSACFSHEIKTPLMGILSYCELLKQNSNLLPKKLIEYVENISSASRQLESLVLGAIEEVNFEYGNKNIQRKNFNSKEAIEKIIKIFARQTEEKGVKIKPILMHTNIISDYTKFNQILYNLISNAVKYSNSNSTITLVSWVEDKKYNFEIRNEGEIISDIEAEKIFNFLYRLNPKTQEGHGIGLCVSKELIELQGGEISFENNPKGVTFKFYLPL